MDCVCFVLSIGGARHGFGCLLLRNIFAPCRRLLHGVELNELSRQLCSQRCHLLEHGGVAPRNPRHRLKLIGKLCGILRLHEDSQLHTFAAGDVALAGEQRDLGLDCINPLLRSRDLSLLFGNRILCRLDCRLGIGVRSFRICLNCQRVRASLFGRSLGGNGIRDGCFGSLERVVRFRELIAAASAASSAAWTAPEAAASCCLAASKSDLASAGAIAEIIEWAVGTDALLTMAAGPASVATVMLPAQKRTVALRGKVSVSRRARPTPLGRSRRCFSTFRTQFTFVTMVHNEADSGEPAPWRGERVLGAIRGCSMRISQSDNARCAAVVCCQRTTGHRVRP